MIRALTWGRVVHCGSRIGILLLVSVAGVVVQCAAIAYYGRVPIVNALVQHLTGPVATLQGNGAVIIVRCANRAFGCSVTTRLVLPRGVVTLTPGAAGLVDVDIHMERPGHIISGRVVTARWEDPTALAAVSALALPNEAVEFELRVGWPFTAMSARATQGIVDYVQGLMVSDPAPSIRLRKSVMSSLDIESSAGTSTATLYPHGADGVLPLRIEWVGFVLNSLIMTMVIVTVAWATTWIRAARRRARGRCWQCGYPTAGCAICSECGARVSRS